MAIADVKTEGLAVPLLKHSAVGVVDEYKPLNLCLVEHLAVIKGESIHIGDKAYEERIPIEQGMMVGTHQHAVSWITRVVFSLGGDPPKGLKVCPLCRISVLGGLRCVCLQVGLTNSGSDAMMM